MTKTRVVCLQILISLACISATRAIESIPIGEIRAHPESYHLQIIPIQGTVRSVLVLKPHDPWQPGDPCYGAYVFVVEDNTGSLEVAVLGHTWKCNQPIGSESPDVSVGEKLLIQAQILAPGHYIEEWRSPIPIDRSTIQTIAVKITQIGN